MHKLLLAAAATLAFLPAPAAFAAPAAANSTMLAPQTEGYERLYRVLVSDPDDLGARRLADIMVDIMGAATPLHAEIEAARPGFEAALADAMMPLVTAYMTRNRALHQDDFLAAIAPLMSEEEAVEIAEFYESDMGQRMLRATRRNYQLSISQERLMSDEEFTRADAQRSVEATRASAMQDLSPAEIDAIAATLMANPRLLQNIMALREPMLAIRVSMDNEPMTGAEEAQLQAIYTTVLARYGY